MLYLSVLLSMFCEPLAHAAKVLPYPEITAPERNADHCYPLLDGAAALVRLELAGLPASAVEASARCVSPHARYYLLRDADVVVFLDADLVVRTSHLLTRDSNRAAWDSDKQALVGVHGKDGAALRKRKRQDRAMARWHGRLANISKITGRQDR